MRRIAAAPDAALRAKPTFHWTPDGPPSKDSVLEVRLREETLVAFRWGRHDGFGTAAYWAEQTRRLQPTPSAQTPSLAEAVCFCLLGGYGITAELNQAAFH